MLAIQKVGDRVAEIGDNEDVPWSGRSPATVASGIILAMLMLEQVRLGMSGYLRQFFVQWKIVYIFICKYSWVHTVLK
jgi:hypothetical protein